MTRVFTETAQPPAPAPRGKTARDEASAPRDGFAALVDDTAPRAPETAKTGSGGTPDRARADTPRNDSAANTQANGAATTDEAARADGRDVTPAGDIAPAEATTGTPKPISSGDAVQAAATPPDSPKPDADAIVAANAQTPAPNAAVVAGPVAPVIVPQIAVAIATTPPAPAGQAGPLSIAAAALAATAATVDAAKPQTYATVEPAPGETAPADATATALLAGSSPAPKAVAKTPAAKSEATPSTDAVATPDVAAKDAPPAAPAAADQKTAHTAAKPDAAPAETPAAPAAREHRAAPVQSAAPDATTQTIAPAPTATHTAASIQSLPTQVSVTASPTAPVPLNGLAMQIAATANSGKTSFEIRLDPAELGRIDVRLEVDRHGNVTSHLTVEKPETLAMLRQDAPQLQRALNDAGLQSSDKAMQFSLSDQSLSGQGNNPQTHSNGNPGGNNRAMQRLVIADDNLSIASAGRNYGRLPGSGSGIDIRV